MATPKMTAPLTVTPKTLGGPGLGNGQVATTTSDVQQLQNLLNMQGFRDYEGKQLAVDGKMGPRTQAAVKAYQTANHLQPTGIVDAQTARIMALPHAISPAGAGGMSVGGGQASGSTGTGLATSGASPIAGGPLPALDPYEEYNLQNRAIQVDQAYDLAMGDLKFRRDLTNDQKTRAIGELNDWRNNGLRDIAERRAMQLRAVNERYGDVLKKQPQEIAARGFSAGGLFQKRINDIQEQKARQVRDYEQGVSQTARGVEEKWGSQTKQVNDQASDALKQMQLQSDQALAMKNAQRLGLHNERIARQQSLAAELKNLGMAT